MTRGRRIPFSAAKLILRKIAAGYRNDEINQALKDAGFRSVSEQTYGRYRRSKYVAASLNAGYEQAVQVGVLDRGRRLLHLDKVAQEIFRRLHGRFNEGSEAFPEAVKIDDILTATRALIPILQEIRTLQKPYHDVKDAQLYPRELTNTGVDKLLAVAQTQQQISEGIIYARMVEALKTFAQEEGYLDDTTQEGETVEVESKMIEGGEGDE